MSLPWFRLYAEFAHDPKVQMLSEVMQRRYIMLMCMRCSNVTVTLRNDEIAFQLRITEQDLAETKALFITKGFIDSDWNLVNWEKRQFSSDADISGAERQRRFREKKRNGPSNVTVTLPDTDTDTDTDTDKRKRASPFLLPTKIPNDVWKDWHEYRNARKGWTANAKQLSANSLLALIEKGNDPRTVVNISIERGWTGLFAAQQSNGQSKHSGNKPSASDNFKGKSYESTPDDQLPASLR